MSESHVSINNESRHSINGKRSGHTYATYLSIKKRNAGITNGGALHK